MFYEMCTASKVMLLTLKTAVVDCQQGVLTAASAVFLHVQISWLPAVSFYLSNVFLGT